MGNFENTSIEYSNKLKSLWHEMKEFHEREVNIIEEYCNHVRNILIPKWNEQFPDVLFKISPFKSIEGHVTEIHIEAYGVEEEIYECVCNVLDDIYDVESNHDNYFHFMYFTYIMEDTKKYYPDMYKELIKFRENNNDKS